jgi:hypothetical protein
VVVISKLDGIKPQLICGTIGGKILVYNPHDESQEKTYFLNLNKNILQVATGELKADSAC